MVRTRRYAHFSRKSGPFLVSTRIGQDPASNHWGGVFEPLPEGQKLFAQAKKPLELDRGILRLCPQLADLEDVSTRSSEEEREILQVTCPGIFGPVAT